MGKCRVDARYLVKSGTRCERGKILLIKVLYFQFVKSLQHAHFVAWQLSGAVQNLATVVDASGREGNGGAWWC